MQPNNVPVSNTTKVPGWRNPPMDQEEKAIINMANNFVPEDGIMVEIGTEYGRGASELAFGARQLSNVTIFSIDLFPNDHPEVGDLLQCWENNLNEARHLFPRVKHIPIRGNSPEVGAQLIADGKLTTIHLLFIDGAHHANGVRLDLETFAPLVVEDGLVLIHDYWKDENSHFIHKDVKQAVDAWHNPDLWNRVDLPGSLIAFFRLADKKPLPDFDEAFSYDEPALVNTDALVYSPKPLVELLTLQEIAARLGLSTSAVRRRYKDVEPAEVRGRTHYYRFENK